MEQNKQEVTLPELRAEVEFIETHLKNNPDSPYAGVLEGSLKKLKIKLNSLAARERYAKRKKQK